MQKIRFVLALLLGKVITFLLVKIFKRGTNAPGIIMLKICPDMLARFKLPTKTICVTGTNGKTGTANLLTQILTKSGLRVVSNTAGSNMAAGLVTALAKEAQFDGRIKADAVVLEVDERSSQFIYPYLVPTYLLCTNLFRDSIMRNGHSGFIFAKINDYLNPQTTLVLNANDGISGCLGENKCPRVFYAVAKNERSTAECPDIVSDLIACPKCHHLLNYEYYHYNHLGVPFCPNCGFKLPEARFIAEAIDFQKGTFVFHDREGQGITLPFHHENFFNVFNITAAAAVAKLIGINDEAIIKGVKEDVDAATGRFVTEEIKGIKVISMLAKNQNPISCSQSFKYLTAEKEECDVVLLITNSKVKAGTSEDISWLYDTDFSPLKEKKIHRIYIGGKRCYDVAECLILNKIEEEKLALYEDYEALGESLVKDAVAKRKIVIFFELYAVDVVARLKEMIKESGNK